jgi:hypothetical protein
MAFLTSTELEIARVFESRYFSKSPRDPLCIDQSPMQITNGFQANNDRAQELHPFGQN